MKHLLPSLRMLLFLTVLTGVAYPLAVTGLSQLLFASQAEGSLVRHGGIVQGSDLLAQEFKSARNFQARPSAAGFNPLPSTGSNLGPTSADLKKVVDERRARLQAENPGSGNPPQDLLFASASGVDPHISPEAARFQCARVAKARNMDNQQVMDLINRFTEGRQFRVLGEPRVNVFALNRALDELPSKGTP